MNHRTESLLVDIMLYGVMGLALLFFYVPIFTLIAFSFQEGRYLTLPFEGFSLKWYGDLFRNSNALNALWNSTIIALVATVAATAIGTFAAIVAVRYRFKGKSAFQAIAGAPLAFPQLLLGIVLLLVVLGAGQMVRLQHGARHGDDRPRRLHRALRHGDRRGAGVELRSAAGRCRA